MLRGGEPLTLLAFLGKRKNNLELEVLQGRETNGKTGSQRGTGGKGRQILSLRLSYTEQVPGQPRATQTLI